MKTLTIGATDGTGRHAVQQSFERGHTVTAFVRDLAKLNITHSNLTVFKGNVMVLTSVEKAVQNQDAVICCLGAPPSKAGKLRSTGTVNIINAMQKNRVSRLICQSSMGFGDSEVILNYASFLTRRIIIPYLLRKTLDDHLLQENLIKKCSLNWTIVRPGPMTNGNFTGSYRHGFQYADRSLKFKIAKADVADFLINQLSSNDYHYKVTGISY